MTEESCEERRLHGDPEKGGGKYQRGISRCLRNVRSSLSGRKIDKSGMHCVVSQTKTSASEMGEIYCVSCFDEGKTYCTTHACCNSATLGYRRSAYSSRNSIHRFKYVLPLLDYSSANAVNKNRPLAVLECTGEKLEASWRKKKWLTCLLFRNLQLRRDVAWDVSLQLNKLITSVFEVLQACESWLTVESPLLR